MKSDEPGTGRYAVLGTVRFAAGKGDDVIISTTEIRSQSAQVTAWINATPEEGERPSRFGSRPNPFDGLYT